MEMKKTNFENFENDVEKVKSTDVYNIHDLMLEHLTVSMTVIHPGKQTRGHTHENVEEVYFFIEGNGKMVVGEKEVDIKQGDIVTIPLGSFHQVKNTSESDLKLIAVFEKYQRE